MAITKNDPVSDRVALEVREAGLGPLPPPLVGEMPAGGGTWPIQTHLSKIGLINQIARAYRWSFDESLRHSRANTVALLRDVEIRDALETRFVPTCQLAWHLEPQDPTSPDQLRAVQKLESVIRLTPRLTDFHKSNLWAIWYGRAGSQLTYKWDYSHPDSEKRMIVKDHRPINGDSLVARWSSEWGILVNALYDGDKEPTDRGYAHFFTSAEREAVVIHIHDMFDVDFYEPELAGQIRGVGVRNAVYWAWWLSSNFLALIADWGERMANGIWTAYYDQTNPQGKQQLEDTLSAYRNSSVLEFPRDREGKSAYDVVIKEVGTASPQLLFELYQYLRSNIRKYITGSNISIDTSIPIGGDMVGIEEDRVSRVVKYDAEKLGETYTADWLPVLTRYNCGPNMPPPKWKFVTDRPNAGSLIGYAKAIRELGGDIEMDQLYEASGLRPGSAGGNISSKLQPMSATAVDNIPQGVPVVQDPNQAQPQQQLQQPAVQVPQQVTPVQ